MRTREPEWGLEGACVITGSGSQLGVTSEDADRPWKLMTTCLQGGRAAEEKNNTPSSPAAQAGTESNADNSSFPERRVLHADVCFHASEFPKQGKIERGEGGLSLSVGTVVRNQPP